MNALAVIQIARKQLGLDEDTYRAVLVRVTGKGSTRDMSEAERQRVVSEFRNHGFMPVQKGLQGPFAKKLQALWIDAWNLGIVRDRRDAAMLMFVKRQTNIDHTRFLLDGKDAAKAVDALKAWMAREAHVDWSDSVALPAWLRCPGAKIAVAQWQILARCEKVDPQGFRAFVSDLAKPVDRMGERDWMPVMNALGALIRTVKAG
ncbi:regulatory protein GemA [Mesorhizobium sp. DCY119]|uniref:regulatory protein GemA n=1 Tax=Mesorhizobium sp. DCY119 TaxID=2108445 RepID=UPI000E6C8C1D|nr:regulatory protein GemA [Mesorhizobium sp. DCY119]RJG46462.1 regulatory protein GemA [Mesorhizobium sp. DCY119]